MDVLSSKLRLAVLWLLTAVAFFGYRTLAVSEDATEVSLLGNDDFATYLLTLMVFAFLSTILAFRINRLMNLVAGGIVGVAQIAMFADGFVGYPSASFNLMTGAGLVSVATILWLAYRWHEPTVATPTDVRARTSQRDRTPAGV